MKNPKILIHRTKTIFTMCCFTLATYYGITQVIRYIQNKDISTITQKIFNDAPNNNYPTFSICFKGGELYWKHEEFLVKETGMTSLQYVDSLQGNIWRHEYDEGLRLYKKKYFDKSDAMKLEIPSMYPDDTIVGTHFVAEKDIQSVHFGYGKENTNLNQIPFHIGHRTPDETCFTRNSSDEIGQIRIYDEILLNSSILSLGNHLSMEVKIVVHYPGQLIQRMKMPAHRFRLEEINKTMFWEGKVSKVSVLKNRPDSNQPCYDGLLSDDTRFRQEAIKRVGCVPIYWKDFYFEDAETNFCESSNDFKKLQNMTSSYRETLNVRSCTSMDSLVFRAKTFSPDSEHITIKLSYMEYIYQETENVQDFSFESFFSSLGGFIGIFLGYSMMQIPELLNGIPSCVKRLKKSVASGKRF